MKELLFGTFLIFSNYLICQESNCKFYKKYKNLKCINEVSSKRGKYSKTESLTEDSISAIIVKDLKLDQIIKEEYFYKKKPTGIWKSLDLKKNIIIHRDFNKVIYFSNLSDEEIKSFQNLKIDSTEIIVHANYKNSNEELNKYISSNIHYPEEMVKNGKEGKVFISFFIEKNGETNVQYIIKGCNPYLDYEAWEVIKNMPRWNPATIDKKPVKSLYTLPISFILL